MADAATLNDLLAEWERREAAGDPTRAEDLCPTRPEMAEPLRQQAGALRALRGVMDLSAYEDPTAARKRPLSSPPGYHVVQVLGRGGMGIVYKAWQEGLDRVVALKMILAGEHADARALARFHAEARTVAKLQHPNIVQVYDIGEHDGCPFIALEYLAGGTLQTLLHQAPPTPDQAARLMETLARAVDYAHGQGVVHRDLKPANILVAGSERPAAGGGQHAAGSKDGNPASKSSGDPASLPTLKIADFGLARQLDSGQRLTATGAVLGTPAYMAPEQATGKTDQLGPPLDQFSLGIIFYEMLTGKLPFDGANEWDIIRKVISDHPAQPTAVNKAVPPALGAICLRCLQKAPADRYPSAGALADDLRRYLQGEKTHAAPPRLRARRRKLALGGAALVALLGLTAALLWPAPARPPLRLGLLVALTGPSAISGRPVVDAIEMAAQELNERGGVDGRRVETVLPDVQDDEADFGPAAEKLITQDHASALLGCWSSVSRKAVVPVVEQHRHLLVFPAEFEGLERSENVVYLGTAPNQVVLPAVDWFCREQGCRRIFIVGQDEVFDRAVTTIVRDHLAKHWPAVEVVGEAFLAGTPDMPAVLKKVRAAAPGLIINLISGDTNIEFFRAFKDPRNGLQAIPTLAIDCTEQELRSLERAQLADVYLVGSYFQTLETVENAQFLRRWHERYGKHRRTFDVMQAAYVGVHLWAQAAAEAGDDPVALRAAMLRQGMAAPEGPIRLDPATGYAHRAGRLARFDRTGALRVVSSSTDLVAPVPFPDTRTEADWTAYLQGLHRGWNGHWWNTPQ